MSTFLRVIQSLIQSLAKMVNEEQLWSEKVELRV